MKTVFNITLKALVGAMLLSGATSLFAEAPLHSVTGSALTAIPADFWFPGSLPYLHQTSISAHQQADGTVKGDAIFQEWSDTRQGHFLIEMRITCLNVIGNTAYFGAVILRSNDLIFAPPGSELIGYVTDSNGVGPDIFWFGPDFIFPGQDCSDRPAIREVPITSGNFIVR